ncbi:MAG TPA: alanine racemase [Candidatus Saccharimonadales bacterium]|jgi:alanine racemase|nr:alanine racemase [Candidatus Saccharimonadales bacterium]
MLRRVAKQALDSFRHNTYRTLNTVEIGRERLLHNVRLIQQQHQDAKVIPVLKGNAYGHGIAEVANILNGAAIDMLAVDGYFEADRIRHISRHRILVMGYVLPENVRLLDARRCSFVVQDTVVLHALGKLKRRVRVHAELNTGMNRMGLAPDELDEYLKVLRKYPSLELEGVMTHLADADNEVDALFTDRQVAIFDEQVSHIFDAGFTPKIIHIAQTAGSIKVRSRFANALRLGIGTYGINPLGPKDAKHLFLSGLQPVLELKSTIIKVLELQKGDTVSYNCTFTAPQPMRVGVLPLGYYEGVPRALSNHGVCTHGRHSLPIVGRICMDHTMIDLTGTKLGLYDEVTVISNDPAQPNSIAGMQAAHDLFAYSILTGLSSSVRRDIV